MKKRLTQVLGRLNDASTNYSALVNDFITIFRDLSQVETNTEEHCQNSDYLSVAEYGTIQQIQDVLDKIQDINNSVADTLNRVKSDIEVLIPKVYDQEPVTAASLDVEKLNVAFNNVLENWSNFEKNITLVLKSRIDDLNQELEKFSENCNKVKYFGF